MKAVIDLKRINYSAGIEYVATVKMTGSLHLDHILSRNSRLKALSLINRYAVKEGFALNNRDARTLYRNIDK